MRSEQTALPVDSHVHTEWSWDAPRGDMVASCRRAVALGLPAVAFTEHVDHTVWRVERDALAPKDHLAGVAGDDDLVRPPPFDVAGYLEGVQRCRDLFPGLRILSGVELGEPHRHAAQVREVLASAQFDRVLGSVHSLRAEDGTFTEPPGLHASRPADRVLTDYLAEVSVLVDSDADFDVLAHVDYAVRSWPGGPGRCDLRRHEEAFRRTLRSLALSGRALEVNTRLPTSRLILGWWREVGGTAISFGSDAHSPEEVARGFHEARRSAGVAGFVMGRHPHDLWTRA